MKKQNTEQLEPLELEQPEFELTQLETEAPQADEPVKKRNRKPKPPVETEVTVTRTEEYHEFAKKIDRKANSGRKAKYEPEISPKLAESYAMEGFKDREIAKKLGIGKTTLYEWAAQYPEFRDALKRGKEPVNADIKAAMLKTAFGYFVNEEEQTITYNPQTHEATSIKKTIKKRYIPPNGTTQFFLAKNRMPELFRDVYKRDMEAKNASESALSIADLISEDAFEGALESGVMADAERESGVHETDKD